MRTQPRVLGSILTLGAGSVFYSHHMADGKDYGARQVPLDIIRHGAW